MTWKEGVVKIKIGINQQSEKKQKMAVLLLTCGVPTTRHPQRRILFASLPVQVNCTESGCGEGARKVRGDAVLSTTHGRVRLELLAEATHAQHYVRELLKPDRQLGCGELEPDPKRPPNSGFRFYRAEPRPAHWGNTAWPDTWAGGRWGPPYALLQGSLRPATASVTPPGPEAPQSCHPVIRRGMVAWAGGRGGPEFFIALAEHPEWGNSHTVWATVVPQDMEVIDAIMRRPLRVANWGPINATELVTPLPFCLIPPNSA